MRQRKNSCLHFLLQQNTSVSLTCRHTYRHIGKILHNNPSTPPLHLLHTNTDKTSAHTVKHKPTSINEPSHRLAISLHMPRANRWPTFCAHLRWYLSGYSGLKSVLWMSLSIYIRVAKVYHCVCVCSLQLPCSIYDSYFKGECRLWKAGSLMKRALRMQENVPACTHTHDAPNLTPTAFVTRA